jgi:uncharacterized protein
MAASLIVDRDVKVPMRDGVQLAADVYRPSEAGKYPVLLQRTPYGKSTAINVASRIFNPLDAVQRGYAVVIQDVRGRFKSEGEWLPFAHEVEDGFDSVEWAAGQTWSTGEVGVYGGSYVGVAALHATLSGSAHVKACMVQAFTSSFHDCWTYSGGAFELGFNLFWVAGPFWGLAWDTVHRLGLSRSEIEEAQEQLSRITADPIAACNHLPLRDFAPFEKSAPYWREWHTHPAYDDYWKRSDVNELAGTIDVPVLNVAGWFDIFLLGGLSLNRLLQERSSDGVRVKHRFVVGPWEHVSHLNLMPSSAGRWDFGPEAISGPRSWTDLTLGFFDQWVKGRVDGSSSGTATNVRYFMMGENRWREAPIWPPQHTPLRMYLRSAGSSNSSRGNGVLDTKAPNNDPADSFAYDPANPVPTVGGRTLFYHPQLGPPGVFDQTEVEQRDDVLVYTSTRLSKPLAIAGPVSVKLYAASSCVDTDFTAKLVDVGPSGFCANIAEGIIRARYRLDFARETFLVPGEPTEFDINLWDVAHTFGVGHRVRLEISSSNFPRFNRNLNCRVNPAEATAADMEVAIQQVFHSSEYPSHLSLPIVEG